ncbi:MAG: hypothetical protein ABR915_23615 [Thermoguttaceae bacterium]
MGKSNPHETIRSVAGLFTIALGVVYLSANPNIWPWWTIAMGWIIIAVGVALLISGERPWRWNVFRRKTHPSYLDARGNPLCGKKDAFFGLSTDWETHTRNGETHYPRRNLDKYPEWPSIQELSCRLFKHPSFTNDTYERLIAWLLTDHASGSRNEMLGMPRSHIVELLRKDTRS